MKLAKKTIADVQKGKLHSLVTETPQTRSAIQHVVSYKWKIQYTQKADAPYILLWEKQQINTEKKFKTVTSP